MGSLSTAPAVATGAADPPRLAPRSAGANWHPNLSTVDVDALEELYRFLAVSAEAIPNHQVDVVDAAGAAALVKGLGAALVTVYHELVVRRGRGLFDGDVTLVDVADVRGPRCESPICHLAHDVDGRHQKAAGR